MAKKETRYRLYIDFASKEDMLYWCACREKRPYIVRERDVLDDYQNGVRFKKFVIKAYADKVKEVIHPIAQGLSYSRLG